MEKLTFDKQTLTKELAEYYKKCKLDSEKLHGEIKNKTEASVVLQNEIQKFKEALKSKEEEYKNLMKEYNDLAHLCNELGGIILSNKL